MHVQGRTDATNSMEISQRRSKLNAVAKDIDSAFSASLDKMAGMSFHLAPSQIRPCPWSESKV